tara:strand:+ start:4000 stop:4155 length:156 start_codon:yes stop_codon:yes gene_type:complete
MTTIKKLTTTVPPKSGPQPQGLNINYNTVKTVRLENKNGSRQDITKYKRTT